MSDRVGIAVSAFFGLLFAFYLLTPTVRVDRAISYFLSPDGGAQ